MRRIQIFILLMSAMVTGAQNLLNGLQACYPLNNSAQNYAPTGSALDGLLVNVNPVNGHTGSPNTACGLQGNTGSYIELPDHPGLKGDSVFFSGWFRFTSFTFVQYLVYTTNGCTSEFEAYSLTAHQSGGKNEFCLTKNDQSCGPKPQIVSQTSIAMGVWYHVCFYINDQVMKLYVNGVLESSTVPNLNFGYQPGFSVFLGVTNQSVFDQPFGGDIDNVRFYNRELTLQEINLLYTLDPPCESSSQPQPVSAFSSKKQICAGSAITFTDQSTHSPTSWSWQFPGGFPSSSTQKNPTINYSGPGVYTVSLMAGNSAGSGNTSVQTITVSNCVSIPEKNALSSEVLVYPNPARDALYVRNAGDKTLVICDLLGKTIHYDKVPVSEDVLKIDLHDAQPGTYLLRILDQSGHTIGYTKLVLIH